MSDLDLLQRVLERARAAGADNADVLLADRRGLSVQWRGGELEELEREEERELGLRVFVGQRQAIASTTLLDDAALVALVDETVTSARSLPEDKWAGLADPLQLASAFPDLDLVDAIEPTVQLLMDRAAAAEAAAREVSGVTNTEGASASWRTGSTTLATSTGFMRSYERSSHGVSVVAIAGSGTGMERDYEYRSATHAADLSDGAELGRKAGENAVRRLGPRKVASATVPVVFHPRVASSFVRHFAGAISGAAIARGTSFLKDSMGEAVFAPGVTITDDPLRRRGQASRPFDAEGIATSRRFLIEDGVLTTWLLDLTAARQLGLASTGHAARGMGSPPSPSPANLTLGAGTPTPEELMADIAEGLYVIEMMGMGVNQVTGDYSRGAAGFWIERGKIAYPVSGVTVAGNMRAMFKALQPASDLEIKGSCDAPTIRIDGLMVAGR